MFFRQKQDKPNTFCINFFCSYWEGRRLWSQMTLGIRNLTRSIWVGVKEPSSKELVEKITGINLLVAFAIATKHYLREEYSYDMEDMQDLIGHIPRFTTPSSNLSLGNQEPSVEDISIEVPKNSQLRKPSTTESRANGSGKAKVYNFKAHDYPTPTNISIEISYYIASFINSVRERDLCDASTTTAMNNG